MPLAPESYEDGEELFPDIPRRTPRAKTLSEPEPEDSDDGSGTGVDAPPHPSPPPASRGEGTGVAGIGTGTGTATGTGTEFRTGSGKNTTKAVTGAFALVAVAGGAILAASTLLGSGEGPPRARPQPPAPRPKPASEPPRAVALSPHEAKKPEPPSELPSALPPTLPGTAAEGPKTKNAAAAPAASGPASPRKGKALKELAARSQAHAAVATILDAYDPLRRVDFRSEDRQFQDYRAKDAREKELIEQVRALGLGGIAAVKDMLRDLDDDGLRIFLAKALSGMRDPEATKAVSDLLAASPGIAVQKTLAVYLPETAESAGVLVGAFGQEQSPRARVMLLDEFARRAGGQNQDDGAPPSVDGETARAFFRKAVLEDPDPVVRAEAVTLLGRRADPQDTDLMADVARKETQLPIRQAAIVSLGATGSSNALPALEDLARNDQAMEIRATAVLAIAKVGTDPAARNGVLRILDQIASSDLREEVRTRAQANASTLRLRTQAEQEERLRPGG